MVPSVALLATLLTATAPASGDVHGFLTGNLRVAVSYYDSVYVRNASQFRLDDAEPLHAGVALRACNSLQPKSWFFCALNHTDPARLNALELAP